MSFTALRHYLFSNPRYLSALMMHKLKLRQRFGWIDRHAATGKKVPLPLVYKITLTTSCNLTCKMCMNIVDHDVPEHPKEPVEIDFTLFGNIIAQFGRTKPSVILSGGEPMLHSKFSDCIKVLEERKIPTHICTNGTLLKKYAHLLKKTKHVSLIVSLDGIREDNDSIRGRGVYDDVVSGIRHLRNENRSIYIGIQHTIQPENVASMFRFCREMVDLKVDWILLNPCWHLSVEQADDYCMFMERTFGIQPHGHKGYIIDYRLDTDLFAEQFGKIRSTRWPVQISCYYDNPVHDMKRMLVDATWFCGNRFCYKQWIRMDIMPDGKVVSCQQFPDVVVGDLRKSTCAEIWNGEPLGNFRNIILRGPLPVCNKCAPIYLYDGNRKIL